MAKRWSARRIGLVTGLALAVIVQLIPVPEGVSREAGCACHWH